MSERGFTMSRSLNRDGVGKLLLMVLVVCCSAHTALSESLPDAEQTAKLVAAVWKDKPKSIDATVYETITRPPKSDQQIRETVEDVFAKDRSRILQKYEPDSRARTIMLDELNATIEMNVERLIKEQKTPRRMKMRIRISSGRERHDIAYARKPDVLLGPNTPFESSSVDLGKGAAGDIRAFEYSHDTKEAKIHSGGWAASHIEDFTGLPHTISLGYASTCAIHDTERRELSNDVWYIIWGQIRSPPAAPQRAIAHETKAQTVGTVLAVLKVRVTNVKVVNASISVLETSVVIVVHVGHQIQTGLLPQVYPLK